MSITPEFGAGVPSDNQLAADVVAAKDVLNKAIERASMAGLKIDVTQVEARALGRRHPWPVVYTEVLRPL